MLFPRDISVTEEHKKIENEEQEKRKVKRNLEQQYQRQAKQMLKEKVMKGHQIIIKGKIHQEGITILNLLISNKIHIQIYKMYKANIIMKDLNHHFQKMTDQKGILNFCNDRRLKHYK